MQFKSQGHVNLLGTHYNTFEFTKDTELTKKGDCIIGVNSDFDVEELKKLEGKITIMIGVEDEKDEITAEINPEFNHKTEMVIRKSDFLDNRTFAINASKAAKDINRELIKKMKDPKAIINIKIEDKKD